MSVPPHVNLQRVADDRLGYWRRQRRCATISDVILESSIMPARIGDSVRRKEDLRLLTGRGCYSDDFNFPGQAYAATLRAPHAHALIRSIDTTPARQMPGVIAVLTGADARADGLNAIPHLATPGTPPDIVLHNPPGSPVPVASHHVLPC